jgi:hypothetical protein
VPPTVRTTLERGLLHLVRCRCGTCQDNLSTCPCSHADYDRRAFAALETGMKRSGNPQAFADRYLEALRARGELPGSPEVALALANEMAAAAPAGAATPPTDEELREAMTQLFIKRYGGMDVLTAPLDRGEQRLAWAVPYVAILAGMAFVFWLSLRWIRGSRKSQARPVAPAPSNGATASATVLAGADRERLQRLEDELAQIE